MIQTFHFHIPLGVNPTRFSAGCLLNGFEFGRSFLRGGFPSRCWSTIHRSPAESIVVCSKSCSDEYDTGDYLRASILVFETLAHHRMRTNGFDEDLELVGVSFRDATDRDIKGKRYPSPAKELRHKKSFSLGMDFFRRFKSPTIFLRVYCERDFLLPIVLEEHAMEKLVGQLLEYDDGVVTDQYQLVHNVAADLGYKAAMVKITEKVYSSYVSRLYFCKNGEEDFVSVSIRPSDAIIVANLFKVPIYVHRDIVFMDAIIANSKRIRSRESKPAYDVSLDSACEGLDLLAEELQLVCNMNQAVEEERFKDAAAWQYKLLEFRNSRT